LNISDNIIDYNTSWDYCLARFNYFDFEKGAEYGLGALDTNIKIVEKSCSEFNVKIGTKEANVQLRNLDLDSRLGEENYLVTFNYGGKSCETIGKSILRPMLNSDSDCIEEIENDVQEDSNWNEFRKCVMETGFYTSRTSEISFDMLKGKWYGEIDSETNGGNVAIYDFKEDQTFDYQIKEYFNSPGTDPMVISEHEIWENNKWKITGDKLELTYFGTEGELWNLTFYVRSEGEQLVMNIATNERLPNEMLKWLKDEHNFIGYRDSLSSIQ
jgi:hypothetical protein